MTNKLFCKNEWAIFAAYCKCRDYPSAKRIAKRAGVSRSTLHRHHNTVHNIPNDYENYLLEVYSRKMKKYLKKDDPSIKIAFLRFLIFIMNNKAVYEILFNEGRKDIIKKMVHLLKPIIISSWDTVGEMDRIFNIYKNEVLGIVEVWSERGFSDKELTMALKAIVYLTEIAYRKLLPLKKLTKDQADQV